MKPEELSRLAREHIERRVRADGPPEPRVLCTHSRNEWNRELLRRTSFEEFHVLGRGADIMVFFNEAGQVAGWRDEGRKGAPMPGWVDREAFRLAVVEELDLPPQTRLGKLEPVELPPLGWTHEAVFFLADVPQPKDVLRVWAAPETLRVIQCLYGPSNQRETLL
jgi:hypothetical protein